MGTVELQDLARRLLEAHGAKARAEAAQKAQQLEAAGNADEAADWRKVEQILEQMQGPRES